MAELSERTVVRRRAGKESSTATNEEEEYDEHEVNEKSQIPEEEEKSRIQEQEEEYDISQDSHWLTRITYLRSIAFIYGTVIHLC